MVFILILQKCFASRSYINFKNGAEIATWWMTNNFNFRDQIREYNDYSWHRATILTDKNRHLPSSRKSVEILSQKTQKEPYNPSTFFFVVNRDAVWITHASNRPPRLLSCDWSKVISCFVSIGRSKFKMYVNSLGTHFLFTYHELMWKKMFSSPKDKESWFCDQNCRVITFWKDARFARSYNLLRFYSKRGACDRRKMLS